MSKTSEGKSPADEQACRQHLYETLLTFSVGPDPKEYFKVLERLLLNYMLGNFIESDSKDDRDTMVDVYMNIKYLIKGIDVYNKLCNSKDQNPS